VEESCITQNIVMESGGGAKSAPGNGVKFTCAIITIQMGATGARLIKSASAMNDLLTLAELESVTGAKRADKQAQILKQAHIYHWWGLDGRPKTTWHHVHAAGTSPLPHPSVTLPAMDLVR